MLDKLLYDDENGSRLSIPEKHLLDFWYTINYFHCTKFSNPHMSFFDLSVINYLFCSAHSQVLLAHLSKGLLTYSITMVRRPSGVRPASVRRPSVHHFHRSSSLKPLGILKPNLKCSFSGNGHIHNDHSIKTSSPQKPLGQSKPNFIWIILRKGGQSLYK